MSDKMLKLAELLRELEKRHRRGAGYYATDAENAEYAVKADVYGEIAFAIEQIFEDE